jgi:hypothetical protein
MNTLFPHNQTFEHFLKRHTKVRREDRVNYWILKSIKIKNK